MCLFVNVVVAETTRHKKRQVRQEHKKKQVMRVICYTLHLV